MRERGSSWTQVQGDVRFGSEADICGTKWHVRFTPESGHVRCKTRCPLSARSGHRRIDLHKQKDRLAGGLSEMGSRFDRLQSKRAATVARDRGPLLLCLSVIVCASASIPSRTPAGMAFGGSSHADTINPCPARSASGHYLRDHAVRLLDRRERHRLCR